MIGTPRSRAAFGAAALVAVVGVVFVVGEEDEDRLPAAAGDGPAPVEPGTSGFEPDETPIGDGSGRSDTPPSSAGSEDDASAGPDAARADHVPDLPDRGEHPPLLDIDGWLQSDVTSLEELRGEVVAVQFWTFACRNCKATLPHLQALYENHADQGFEIVGIHSPEFDFEADVGNIEEAAAELGVTWPIARDTDKRTFHSWQEGPTGYWPRIYLLDRDGHVRYDARGEGRYEEIDAAVRALLAEDPQG